MADSSVQANNPYASASLYVGDLSESVTEAQLFETFNVIGPVASIRVCRDSRTRRSLGYAYVNFHSVQDAEKALDTMNFQNIGGKPCRIMWSQRDPRLRQSGKGNIFVKNLHESIDNKTLYDTFSVFGKILSCKVAVDRKSNRSIGYGYVHYVNEKSATEAIKGVNGMTISGKKVEAEPFKSRAERAKEGKDQPLTFTNVYVKYIPREISKEELIKMFEKEVSGEVTHSSYWAQPYGVSACLNFKTSEQAKKAVELFNGREIKISDDEKESKEDKKDGDENVGDDNQRKLYVARAEKRSERLRNQERERRKKQLSFSRNSAANLYVKNIDTTLSKDSLRALFEPFGKILSVCIMCDEKGQSRGFGFVQFEKKDSAVRAKSELNSKMYMGRPLYVSVAQSKSYREKMLKKTRRNGQFMMRRRQRQIYPLMQGAPFNQGYAGQFMGPGPAQPPFGGPYNRPGMPGGFNQAQNPMMRPIGYNPMFMQPGPAQQSINTSNINPMASLQNQQMASSGFNQNIRQQQNSTSIINYGNSASRGNQGNIASGQISASQQQQPPVSSVQQNVHSMPIQQVPQQSVDQSSQQTSAPIVESTPLTTNMLQNAKPAERKRLIGERLFPKIQVVEPRLAGKITGMLLEMDNTELLILLSDQQALMTKINEALAVLKDHQQKQSQSNVASGANSSNPNRSQPNRGSQANRSSQPNRHSQSNQNI